MRRPTTSTLFPYTTLFRSPRGEVGERQALDPVAAQDLADAHPAPDLDARVGRGPVAQRPAGVQRRARRQHLDAAQQPGQVRSEEHTSELQSRQYLVCRLLL